MRTQAKTERDALQGYWPIFLQLRVIAKGLGDTEMQQSQGKCDPGSHTDLDAAVEDMGLGRGQGSIVAQPVKLLPVTPGFHTAALV